MKIKQCEQENSFIYKKETYQIIGAAMDVPNHLGTGFLEAVYQEALEIEFADRNIPFDAQKDISISYKNRRLSKQYIADFLCYKKIIVEIKAIKKVTEIEEAQLINYLNATGLQVGLLINFGSTRLEWKRYARTQEHI